jgi:anti-anti-sigma factor
MNLEVNQLDDSIKQLKLSGRLDVKGTNEIENSFSAHVTSGAIFILIDMSEVEFLASTGMRLLLLNAKVLAKRNGKMVLLKPQPLIKEALIMVGFDELIPIYDDFEEALAVFKADVCE